MSPSSPYMTIAEVADHLRCCRRHVERLIKNGNLMKYKNGRRTLLGRKQVLAYARKMRCK
jgi:excisionase family DNA binding protein